MNTAQKTVLAVAFLVLVGAGLFSRLTPVRVDGVDCADAPMEMASDCVLAEGDRTDSQVVVSSVVLASAFVGVRLIRRRELTAERRVAEQAEAEISVFRPSTSSAA